MRRIEGNDLKKYKLEVAKVTIFVSKKIKKSFRPFLAYHVALAVAHLNMQEYFTFIHMLNCLVYFILS